MLRQPHSRHLTRRTTRVNNKNGTNLLNRDTSIRIDTLRRTLNDLGTTTVSMVRGKLTHSPPRRPTRMVKQRMRPHDRVYRKRFLLMINYGMDTSLFRHLITKTSILLFATTLLLRVIRSRNRVSRTKTFQLALNTLRRTRRHTRTT